jgi:endonuclease-3 related protein
MSSLSAIYKKLYASFGPQHWWPGESPFEVMIGAILTQNTNWQNVEKAICNLKRSNLFSPAKLNALPAKRLAKLIRPAGYYNIKAKRLKNFLVFLFRDYRANISRMRKADTGLLRKQLLGVNGIGPETADSILLYALNKPVFVVDTYTKRILSRHGFIAQDAEYHEVQNFFMQNLENKVQLFNEFHALIVRLGKEFCLKNNPRCSLCPLNKLTRRPNA